jgi:AraC-like DNA-binding protein
MEQMLRPTVVFDSRGMPPALAIEAWQEIAGPTLRIGIEKADRERFQLSLQAVRLVDTVVTAAQTTAQSMHRDLDRVHRDGLDQYGFFLQITGSRIARVSGTDSLLMPGDLQFVDMAQEDSTVASDGRTTTLYVPRHLVDADVPDAWQMHGTIFRNTAARVFAHQALTLFDPESAWSMAMAAYLERSLLSIAIGCLFESRLHAEGAPPVTVDRSLRRRIEHYIEDHLEDHDVDAHRICVEFGLSRSVVYRVFQPHGGLNRYMLASRLRRVRRLLLDGDDRSIAEIAYACGFVSPAHFNREFRRVFGVTPSDVRRHHLAGGQAHAETRSLDQFFRSISR